MAKDFVSTRNIKKKKKKSKNKKIKVNIKSPFITDANVVNIHKSKAHKIRWTNDHCFTHYLIT